jgi:hypothetical protein
MTLMRRRSNPGGGLERLEVLKGMEELLVVKFVARKLCWQPTEGSEKQEQRVAQEN